MESAGQPEPEVALLDVRPEADFLNSHAAGAAGIPLEELAARVHELPPANASISITDTDPQRARQAADFLGQRGHAVVIVPWDAAAAIASGPSRVRLWRPNSFLGEALRLIREQEQYGSARRGRAMDVACGTGRDSVYLAIEGYEVLAVDLLPDALQHATDLASRTGVRIQTAMVDLEHGAALPPGEFDLVTVFRYLHRPLFPALRNAVAPGGYVVYETFHDRNRETGQRPGNPAHLLQTGELAQAFAGFEILIARDPVERDGRFFSSLLAHRTG